MTIQPEIRLLTAADAAVLHRVAPDAFDGPVDARWTAEFLADARLLSAMLDHGRALGCTEAWVLTEVDNVAARALYERAGGTAEMSVLYSYSFASKTERSE